MNSWQTSDLENLAKTLTVIADGQKAYGKEINVKHIFEYFKFKLEGRFSVDQIVFAIQKYTDAKNDIPAPADIIKILNPEAPKVTEAQYYQACREYERSGFNEFTDAYETKKLYEQQANQARENFTLENAQIQSLVIGSVKRIGNNS
jgi:hypothetical protein